MCGDLDSLLAAVEAEQPDVVVTDIRMPPGGEAEGIQAAEQLRETNPEVGVVVLSQYASPAYVLALLSGGSARRAYLLKERVKDVEQLAAAIHAVAEGGSVIDPEVVEALVAENARSEDSPLNDLTPRERDVLREMAEGKTNAAIAEALFLTERSVEKVIHSIFLKLGLTGKRWSTSASRPSSSTWPRALSTGVGPRCSCRGRARTRSSACRRSPRRGRAAGRASHPGGRLPDDLEVDGSLLLSHRDRRPFAVADTFERFDAAPVDRRRDAGWVARARREVDRDRLSRRA